MKVEIFHNVAKDDSGRLLGFFGYQPDHNVVKVFEYNTAPLPGYTLSDVAEDAFRVGNGVDNKSDDYFRRELRTLSVGDLVRIEGQWFRCDAVGWSGLVDDPNDITKAHEGEHGTQPWKDEE
ncbi:hypothetical protein [Spirillospora sp. NPDC047279]|uniref:hypothetical protein n=1 Tax=Spirillospora sp. NPDC047279 TaxID=3155478 RepID=UPI0034062FC1